MNPQLHDEFVALCAVFHSGDITDEEWALLQVHLAYCESCQEVFEQYKQTSKEVIPLLAGSAAWESKEQPVESAEEFRLAEARLVEAAGRMEQPAAAVGRKSMAGGRVLEGALAACIGGVVVFASMHFLGRETKQQTLAVVSTPIITKSSASPVASQKETDQLAAQQSREQVATLRAKVQGLEKEYAEARSATADLRQQLETEREQREQMTASEASLNNQLANTKAELQSLQAKMTSTETASGQQSAQVAVLQGKINHLNATLEDVNTALEDKDRMLALDKDLLAHDRDIRDLMGARNLYIADIFDTTESGKTAKPFGRIFYTQDRSLIFYGFDLEKQPGIKQSVAFQAWGSGADRQPVSLGLFFQDDNHKRWVLRCTDAKTLSRLNMVFVTVEPPGGSDKPTGKQLLRAYLQIQPNHP